MTVGAQSFALRLVDLPRASFVQEATRGRSASKASKRSATSRRPCAGCVAQRLATRLQRPEQICSRPFDVILEFCGVAAQRPDLLVWVTDGQTHMIPYISAAMMAALSRPRPFYQRQWPFYQGARRAMTVVSRLMAVLSRPMAVLSRGAKSNASRPMAVLSRPMAVLSRGATLEPG